MKEQQQWHCGAVTYHTLCQHPDIAQQIPGFLWRSSLKHASLADLHMPMFVEAQIHLDGGRCKWCSQTSAIRITMPIRTVATEKQYSNLTEIRVWSDNYFQAAQEKYTNQVTHTDLV
jgi:hypothetical protein